MQKVELGQDTAASHVMPESWLGCDHRGVAGVAEVLAADELAGYENAARTRATESKLKTRIL
jgi:hypothetical protein